jgi:hypothetical protein
VAVPDKISAKVGEQFDKFATVKSVSDLAEKQTTLERDHQTTREKLTELSIRFDIYFGDKAKDRAAVQNITDRAIDTVLTSKDPVERTVGLRVARNVLSKASANHVAIDHKKIEKNGLALLEQSFEGNERVELKETLSEFARQRTLMVPEQSRPNPAYKYIVGGDQTLDGSNWENVTFVNCKIKYGDGWLSLKNVRFINCIFDVFLESTGKEFYEVLFKSPDLIPTVTVKSPGRGPDSQGRSS